MDKLDVKIFRELFQGELGVPLSTDPRKPYRAIARSLGIDELTVAERLGKLRKAGFLKGWLVFFNPSLAGLRLVQTLVNVESKIRDGVVERVSSLECVGAIVEHVGPTMYMVVAGENEAEIQDNLRLVEARTGTSILTSLIQFPPTEVSLSETDFEIVRVLSGDPRMRYADIAKNLRISSRTVKRRLTLMVDGKALFAIPSMDPGSLEGALLVDLTVVYTKKAAKGSVNRELVSKLDDWMIRAQFGDRESAFFNLFVTKIGTIDDILEIVKAIEGVEDARADLVQSRIEFFDHYSAMIEKSLARRV